MGSENQFELFLKSTLDRLFHSFLIFMPEFPHELNFLIYKSPNTLPI